MPATERRRPGPGRTRRTRRIAVSRDHIADRDHGERGAGAEARRRQADGKAAAVGEPFHRIADAGRVDRARRRCRIAPRRNKAWQGVGERIDDPAGADQDAAEATISLARVRAERVDDPALDRRQPGLKRDEDAERHLDAAIDQPCACDRMDEQRPAVLQVGDQHHADDGQMSCRQRVARTAEALDSTIVVVAAMVSVPV